MKWLKSNWKLVLASAGITLLNLAAYGLVYWFVTVYYPGEAARWSQPVEEVP